MTDQEKKLKSGFTTGAAAAAATKGALCMLMEGIAPKKVQIAFLSHGFVYIPIHTCDILNKNRAICTVIKDAGDDPDITHKAEIGVKVTLFDIDSDYNKVIIKGGKGVGKVTKPGLEIPPGEAAINSGPQKMIFLAVKDVMESYKSPFSVQVEIFVPEGEILAQKTLNARLGILGGISILGTTGIVRPMSHDAYIATIQSSFSVAHATGVRHVVLTTGRRSEKFAQKLWKDLPEEAFIQIGDFFKVSLDAACAKEFDQITLAVFFGKAVKMAQKFPHTHAAKSTMSLNKLSDWSFEITKDRNLCDQILAANTARHAFDILMERDSKVVEYVGYKMIDGAYYFASKDSNIHGVIFDFEGNIVFDSNQVK